MSRSRSAVSLLTLSGERRPLTTAKAACTPDAAVTALTLDRASIPEDCLLAWHFKASNGMEGEGHYVHGTYKALELRPAGLTVATEKVERDGTVEINVTAKGLALFVMIESELDGRYSDNAFDLAAGESRRIVFAPAKPLGEGVTPSFRIYDLESCQSVD